MSYELEINGIYMVNNIIKEKSYQFSLKIVKLYKILIDQQKEYIIGRQILRSGTSIGANVEEAIGSHSKNDFTYKISIAYKEARETNYWIRLLRDSKIIDLANSNEILSDSHELVKILSSIQKTLKEKQIHNS